MATVYKRKESRPIPEGAEIITYRGKPYATWTDANGKARRAPLNEAGNRIVQVAECYTAQYFDETGKRRKAATGCHDKAQAQRVAERIETEVALKRRGHIDPTAERYSKQARRPITEHVTEFQIALSSRGNTAKHVDMTLQRVRFIIEKSEAEHTKDLTASVVQEAIGGIRDAGRSLETCNSYLRAIKSFSRWMWRDKRIPDDPLAPLERYSTDVDRRHVRRELTPEELNFLLPFVERHTLPAHNLPGPDRAVAYRVAIGTGFRASELRSLTTASFELDGDPPTVTVSAAYSKRRRKDVQPIRMDLADLLRPWLAERPRDEQPFARLPKSAGRMLCKDLAAARERWIADAEDDPEEQARREESEFLCYEDSSGRFADFHGVTRHGYISAIVAGGASVKTAQELARHSDPRLTIGRYSHARLHDLRGALDALPSTTPSESHSQPQAMRATGTDDQTAEVARGQMRGQYGGKTVQNVASRGERHGISTGSGSRTEAVEEASPNVLSLRGLATKKPRPARRGERAEGTGLEPARDFSPPHFQSDATCPDSPGKTLVPEGMGADAGAIEMKSAHDDADLGVIIDAWPTLPEAIRSSILAMVTAGRCGGLTDGQG
jgi:site-specific recombinase XerD